MIRATSLALVALLATFSARAVDPGHWFEVEVYIFKRDAVAKEHWAEQTKPVALRGNVDLISPIALTEYVLRPAVTCMNEDPIAQLYDLTRSLMADCVAQDPIIQKRSPNIIPFNIGEPKPITAYQGDGPTLLANSQNQFHDLIKKVQRQTGVHNLLHMTWQQPMLSRRNAKAVHLFAGQDLGYQYQADGFPIKQLSEEPETGLNQTHDAEHIDEQSATDITNQELTADNSQATSDISANEEHAVTSANENTDSEPVHHPVWELDGKLNIYLQHYLYIQADLRLREQGILEHKFDEGEDAELLEHNTADEHVQKAEHFLFSIPMIQNRRVRSGEIHYFDHPKMGMFIQIRKMKQPEERPLEQSEALPENIDETTTP